MKTPAQITEEVLTPYMDKPLSVVVGKIAIIIDTAITADRAQFFDTTSSASVQHYIDTGRYLLHEEVAEMERINQ